MIYIEEQGLRDGLQSLKQTFTTAEKLSWIEQLKNAGIRRIQVGSFVHPKYVPSMGDTDQLFQLLPEDPEVIYTALVLNYKGVERAVAAKVKHLSISLSASETHSLKNTRMSIAQAQTELKRMISYALQEGITVRGGVQNAFGCRYEGKISETAVMQLSSFLLDCGVSEVVLADSTGMGNPRQVRRIMSEVVKISEGKLVGLHLHNTENKGYANVYAGLEAGVRLFDTAFGGLGGCPFIKGATGNIATEDTVHLLHQLGEKTAVNWQAVAKVSQELEDRLQKPLPGLLYTYSSNSSIQFI